MKCTVGKATGTHYRPAITPTQRLIMRGLAAGLPLSFVRRGLGLTERGFDVQLALLFSKYGASGLEDFFKKVRQSP